MTAHVRSVGTKRSGSCRRPSGVRSVPEEESSTWNRRTRDLVRSQDQTEIKSEATAVRVAQEELDRLVRFPSKGPLLVSLVEGIIKTMIH